MTQAAIIVAVDGSDHSLAALDWARDAALRHDAPLTVAHVLPDHAQLYAARRATVGGEAPETGDPVLAAVRERLTAEGRALPRELRWVSLDGSVPEALRSIGSGARMLVMGSRGRGGFVSLLLGSNSRAVSSTAPCPVVVVPHTTHDADDATGTHRGSAYGLPGGPVVLGLETAQTPEDVIEFAFDEARTRAAELRVISAYPVPPSPLLVLGPAPIPQVALEHDEDPPVADATRRAQEDRLRTPHEHHPEVRIEPVVAPADAAAQLVEASAGAALVVVGRHRPRLTPGSLLMGSVANAVLHHAHCPVAVVPPTTAD
ncbi:universal stress protein [Streptomyces sp. BI20]|uniref:universal stress protein n=1 Tax=Streptomyces sp. BI20 TaxID=3403460 RepID=UPI003C756752